MTTLEDIKTCMLDYMSYEVINDDNIEYYDDDGHCGDGLWKQIKSYWKYDFNTNEDLKYVISGEWIDDELDLDGGRDYILSHSNVKPLIFDYIVNTLKWNKSDFEDIIYNSLTFNEELGWMFDEKVEEDKKVCDNALKTEDIYIPRFIKYHNSMKDRLDTIDALKFISASKIDNNYSIYELTSFGCTIPKGEIIKLLINDGF